MNKITRKEALERVLGMEEVQADAEVVEVLEKMVEQVSKKREGKTPKQVENDKIVEKIYGVIAEKEDITIAGLVEAFDREFSPQKISALVKKLVDAGKVTRNKDGKVTSYKVND